MVAVNIDISPSMTLRCVNGHRTSIPIAELRRNKDRAPSICRECFNPMLPLSVRGTLTPASSGHSNKSLVSTPGPAESHRTVEGKLQCDACVIGNHGACTGVGCWCSSAPSTKDAHRPGPIDQQLHGNATGDARWDS